MMHANTLDLGAFARLARSVGNAVEYQLEVVVASDQLAVPLK
jgi:hypothetical protein